MLARNKAVIGFVVISLLMLCPFLVALAFAQPSAPAETAPAVKASVGDSGTVALAVALVVGLSCLGAGYAVGRVGSAALGAVSENPELLGKTLIFVGLAEGIAIYGLIVGIMLLGKL